MSPDENLLCSPEEKVRLEIANQADVIEFLADFVAKGRTRITESDILAIHHLTIKRIYPCSGNFRNVTTEIQIIGTDHKPSHPSQVRIDVRDMLEGYTTVGRVLTLFIERLA